MTTYTLTDQQNTISAGNGADIFQGVGGGADSLRGNGGNDYFDIQTGQTGSIDGGAGYDRIHLSGAGYNQLDAGLQITGVEELVVDTSNLSATIAQLQGFTSFGVNNGGDSFGLSLRGAGGTLNFSTSYTEPQELDVNAEVLTSRIVLTGSAGRNEFIGSDFGDNLNGGLGIDVVRGGAGSDLVNGGLGRDFLYGDDGKDVFFFNTALAGNYDHLGDFRPADDTIRLDHHIFQWTGQTLGTLTASAFKVIGNGQTVDANDHILYNQNTGLIYYDKDGAGGTAAVVFAVADNFSGDIPVLTNQDFLIT